jgi:hypothetical protein
VERETQGVGPVPLQLSQKASHLQAKEGSLGLDFTFQPPEL